jgi:hypothetical protein
MANRAIALKKCSDIAAARLRQRLKTNTIVKTRVKTTYKIKIALNFIVGFFSSWSR